MNVVLLWIAQGLGVGRISIAPGTFGSLLGLLWFALLLLIGDFWCFGAVVVAVVPVAAWICGKAARLLGERDPPSIVLDEIVAVPVCFVGWLGIVTFKTGVFPHPAYFVSDQTWLLTVAVFASFRFFDVLKPWPIFQSQFLRRGWGITADDVLAAVYSNVVVLAAYAGKALFSR